MWDSNMELAFTQRQLIVQLIFNALAHMSILNKHVTRVYEVKAVQLHVEVPIQVLC